MKQTVEEKAAKQAEQDELEAERNPDQGGAHGRPVLRGRLEDDEDRRKDTSRRRRNLQLGLYGCFSGTAAVEKRTQQGKNGV